jgi:uncharacterized protein
MRFEEIDADYFSTFHKTFHGDTPEIFTVCSKCGGACEFNKIGTLMPGEREYMARCAGLSPAEFSDRFLDTIVMADGMELDVLRLINGCPFLDRGTFECGCRTYKVVLCEIYPIGFHVEGGRVEFKIDDWCPLADTLRFRKHFEETGIPAIASLPVPVAWYQEVSCYDDLYFDYHALEAHRKDRSERQTFAIEDLLRFQRAAHENDPKERFHPFPEELVGLASLSRRSHPNSEVQS